MKRLTLLFASVAFGLTLAAAHAGGLKSLGNALSYPVKKGARNTGKSAGSVAGGASRGINHGAQSVQYPVRKSGENTSKTAHKVVGK